MARAFFKRSMLSGEELDKSATPLYLCHVLEISKSLALRNTRESASRKLAVKSLWQAAGRSGEVAYLSYMRLRWDPHFKCVHADFAQVNHSHTHTHTHTAARTHTAAPLTPTLTQLAHSITQLYSLPHSHS
jgi:hypothetical protein